MSRNIYIIRFESKNFGVEKNKKYIYNVLNIPYIPQTNQIESYFSELKHYIKLDSKIEYNDLFKSIKKSIKKIKNSHYKNHFNNSLNNQKFRKKISYKSKKNYK